MQYIAGPKLNWTCGDGLPHWFQTWKMKIRFTLDGELESLAREPKCNLLLHCSCDTGLGLNQSWGIAEKDLIIKKSGINLRGIVSHKEMNFELTTTYSKSSNRPTSVVINFFAGIQNQMSLCQYPIEMCNIFQRGIFCLDFLMRPFCQKSLLMVKTLWLLEYDKDSKD